MEAIASRFTGLLGTEVQKGETFRGRQPKGETDGTKTAKMVPGLEVKNVSKLVTRALDLKETGTKRPNGCSPKCETFDC